MSNRDNYSRLLTSCFVAVCFDVDGYGEENVCDIFAANSLIALSALVAAGSDYHHVTFHRDRPHVYGLAHAKLAGEFCAPSC